MEKELIKLAQKIVGTSIDGEPGPLTAKAISDYFDQKQVRPLLSLVPNIRSSSIGAQMVTVIQAEAKLKKLEMKFVDGFLGPLTLQAADELMGKKFSRLDEHAKEPKTSLTKIYGEVGKNQTRVQVPYSLLLAWDLRQSLTSFSCHEKVVGDLTNIFGRVLDAYGEDDIKRLRLNRFGGCLNVRKKRGGKTWSTHAWGIACDFDPQQNQLRWGRDRAVLARPEYTEWWKIWEDVGWTSLGRKYDFDWMHVQAIGGK